MPDRWEQQRVDRADNEILNRVSDEDLRDAHSIQFRAIRLVIILSRNSKKPYLSALGPPSAVKRKGSHLVRNATVWSYAVLATGTEAHGKSLISHLSRVKRLKDRWRALRRREIIAEKIGLKRLTLAKPHYYYKVRVLHFNNAPRPLIPHGRIKSF